MRVKFIGLLAVLTVVLVSTATAAGAALPAPSSFTITARGPVSRGVTIKPIMKKRRDLGLVVFKGRERKEVGTVVLGIFSGRPLIHWNLSVHGQRLGAGSYVISLRVFHDGKPTRTPAPPPQKFTITGYTVRVT